MTDEQRLKEIRERWARASFPEQIFTSHAKQDIDFLLSLVDSQVAEPVFPESSTRIVKRWLLEARNGRALESVLLERDRELLERYIAQFATFMRSACIEKVKGLAKAHRAHAKEHEGQTLGELQIVRAEECEIIAKMLESVTIQEQEKQK